jgi:hypothetical protein
MGIRNILKFTDVVAGWVILAHKEMRHLHDIHKSDQRIEVGGRICTSFG